MTFLMVLTLLCPIYVSSSLTIFYFLKKKIFYTLSLTIYITKVIVKTEFLWDL